VVARERWVPQEAKVLLEREVPRVDRPRLLLVGVLLAGVGLR
jgi:hypothetical protein